MLSRRKEENNLGEGAEGKEEVGAEQMGRCWVAKVKTSPYLMWIL